MGTLNTDTRRHNIIKVTNPNIVVAYVKPPISYQLELQPHFHMYNSNMCKIQSVHKK